MTFDLQKMFERKHALVRPLTARHVFSLSASILLSASDGEKVAGGRMMCLRESGERAGVRCRNFGSNGSITVEGVKVGATAETTTANARANREFLEKV
jgi:hypothetical protein